jgi:hypothetical protein
MNMKFIFIFIFYLREEIMLRFAATSLFLLLTSLVPPSNCQSDSKPESSGNRAISKTTAGAGAEPIQDNSFLIEEAYNQEDGVVQHISYLQHSFTSRDWLYTQTDEWPIRTTKHQLSVTISGVHSGGVSGLGLGDTAINYRYQLVGSGAAKLAIAPRVTMLAPTGNYRLSRGSGAFGLQTNLPISVQHGAHFVSHWNAGVTWIPRALSTTGEQARVVNVNLGQSSVWLASHRFNVILETLWTSTAEVLRTSSTARRQDLFLSPAVRWAHNFPSGLQIVPGIGFPVGVGPSSGEKGLIFYLSFEHPWRIAHSR